MMKKIFANMQCRLQTALVYVLYRGDEWPTTAAENNLRQGGPTSALLWATFQNYSSLRASSG